MVPLALDHLYPMVAPTRNYPPRHRVGSTQLQLYIKILLFYMAVVYFCETCRYARAKERGETRRAPRERAPGRARAPEFHGAARRAAAAAAGATGTRSDKKMNTVYLRSVE